MKKIALITAGIILFTILAGFNYLLWDNMAKKEKLKEAKTLVMENNESINFLLEEVTSKKKDISEIRKQRDTLQEQINQFEETEATYIEQIDLLNSKVEKHYEEVNSLDIIIDALTLTVDNNYFINFLTTNWANYINKKNYFLPFVYQGNKLILLDSKDDLLPSVDKFKEQYKNVVSIEVLSAQKLDIRRDSGVEFDGLHFIVKFNIVLEKDDKGIPVEDKYFVEGENDFTIKFTYDSIQNTWLVASMD